MAFLNGPLNKSLYTQQMELLGKCLLACPDSIKFRYQDIAGQKQLFGFLNNNEMAINVSKLLKKTDYTHIDLSEFDSHAFLKHPNTNIYDNYYYNEKGTCPKFLPGEYAGIKDYTGSGYLPVNRLMYGNGTKYAADINNILIDSSKPALDILKTLFISSGLNKIMPDTSQIEAESYRGEHSTSQAEIQQRIESIKTSDGFTTTPAFMSTSSDKEIAKDFSGGVLIKFEELYGKSIECISHFPDEKEYLLPPSNIQWLEYKEKSIDNYGYIQTVHEFKARVVNPLITEENDPDFKEIEGFKKMVNWAEKNNIDTSFITPFNQYVYLSDCLCDDNLDLEEWIACVIEKTLINAFDQVIDFGNQVANQIETRMFIPDLSPLDSLAELNCIMI